MGIALTPGSPDSVRFQGTTLTWSRCYKESDNKLDCVTCHNPHRNAETSAAWYESRCLQCHSSAGATVNRTRQTGERDGRECAEHSCPIQPASGCIECHMPKLATPMAHTRFHRSLHPRPSGARHEPTALMGATNVARHPQGDTDESSIIPDCGDSARRIEFSGRCAGRRRRQAGARPAAARGLYRSRVLR